MKSQVVLLALGLIGAFGVPVDDQTSRAIVEETQDLKPIPTSDPTTKIIKDASTAIALDTKDEPILRVIVEDKLQSVPLNEDKVTIATVLETIDSDLKNIINLEESSVNVEDGGFKVPTEMQDFNSMLEASPELPLPETVMFDNIEENEAENAISMDTSGLIDLSAKGDVYRYSIDDELVAAARGAVFPIFKRRKQRPRRRFAMRRFFRNPYLRRPLRRQQFFYPFYSFYRPRSLPLYNYY